MHAHARACACVCSYARARQASARAHSARSWLAPSHTPLRAPPVYLKDTPVGLSGLRPTQGTVAVAGVLILRPVRRDRSTWPVAAVNGLCPDTRQTPSLTEPNESICSVWPYDPSSSVDFPLNANLRKNLTHLLLFPRAPERDAIFVRPAAHLITRHREELLFAHLPCCNQRPLPTSRAYCRVGPRPLQNNRWRSWCSDGTAYSRRDDLRTCWAQMNAVVPHILAGKCHRWHKARTSVMGNLFHRWNQQVLTALL